MAENKKMTRKEKIAAGLEKQPKKSTARAIERKEERESTYKAKLNNSPIAPRKMRLVVDLIRGKNVEHALNILKHTPKAGAEPVRKLLLSAIANMTDKTGGAVSEESMYIREAFVDEAGMLKRYRPAPQGRAHRIRKRSNHVTLILDSNDSEA